MKGATQFYFEGGGKENVSIHAPVKGATCFSLMLLLIAFCFNPRAREGRDAKVSQKYCKNASFNPRAREGRDRKSLVRSPMILKVSIHAPVKGATTRFVAASPLDTRFNPRAREGRDATTIIVSLQSSGFNPRAREGRDTLKPRYTQTPL